MSSININQNTSIDLMIELLNSNRKISLSFGGGSMFPCIKNGDIAIIDKVDISHVYIGDVIVFKSKKKLIAHRIVKRKITDNNLIIETKGDNEFFSDGILNLDDYLAKVIYIKKSNKKKIITSKARALFSYFLTPLYRTIFKLTRN